MHICSQPETVLSSNPLLSLFLRVIAMKDIAAARILYDFTVKCFAAVPLAATPLTFFVNAPFGRFTPSGDSIFLVDGIKAWIVMELVSPLTFTYSFLRAPLAPWTSSPQSESPSSLLAGLFLVHYLNRAVISPLRTPSRSKSHIIVPITAVFFNLVNGSLMGSYLSSPAAEKHLAGAFERPLFWVGIALWVFGFAGNILHDEILLNLRRKMMKQRNENGRTKDNNTNGNVGDKSETKKNKNNAAEQNGSKGGQHYAIPHGYLYKYISYPNYFCEWVEWAGFALAASPLPFCLSFTAAAAEAFPGVVSVLPSWSLTALSPPWLFFYLEVFLMLPRAVKGHAWYHGKFPDYPKERKVVIPFLL